MGAGRIVSQMLVYIRAYVRTYMGLCVCVSCACPYGLGYKGNVPLAGPRSRARSPAEACPSYRPKLPPPSDGQGLVPARAEASPPADLRRRRVHEARELHQQRVLLAGGALAVERANAREVAPRCTAVAEADDSADGAVEVLGRHARTPAYGQDLLDLCVTGNHYARAYVRTSAIVSPSPRLGPGWKLSTR